MMNRLVVSAIVISFAVHTQVATARQPGATAVDVVVRAAMQTRRIPGVAVAVVQDGAVTLQRAYGSANLETDTPITVDSIFEIASLTKQFTAAAILMLAEDGKLTVDDLLSAYIEPMPAGWQRITIRHLLTHTSGLDVSALPRINGVALMSVDRQQAFDYIAQQKMFMPTGRTGWYSDAGYVLLGMVIEKVTRRSYRDFIIERIFTPLQMADSSLRDKTRVLKRRVSTYANRGGETVNWRRESDYELTSAFGIHSTLADLAAWDRSLRRATLVTRASLEAMWTPARLENGQVARIYGHRYGFGWELSNLRGVPTVGHGGASGTYILRFVNEPLTIIVLTNLESEERHPRALARAIAGAIRDQYRPPETLTPTSDPDPALTRELQTLLGDIAARRPSVMMSDDYAAWYRSSVGAQAVMARQVGTATALRYLAHDAVSGASLWGAEPVEKIVHYAVDAAGRSYVLSAGITAGRRVADLDIQLSTAERP